MIYITLGSQKFQFNRLLRYVDELIEQKAIEADVFAQIGFSDYLPKNYKYKDFLARADFMIMMNKADVVITHGGTGAIVNALKAGKKVIAVPRKKSFHEHVDDHQEQIVNSFVMQNTILGASNKQELRTSLQIIENKKFDTFKSNNQNFIECLKTHIDS